MFRWESQRRHRDCDGQTRRDFLKVGTLGLGGFGLADLLRLKAEAAKSGASLSDKSVVWLWLGGGPTHIETFDPKMTAPVEYRSVTGEVATNVPGITLGGHFREMAQVADKLAFLRSFAHNDSSHGSGTHYVMTGYSNRKSDNGGLPTRPSIGSITSRLRGASHPVSGMPTYVSLGRVGADGAAFLGKAYEPFGNNAEAKTSMTLTTSAARVGDRRTLLQGVDRFRRDADATGLMTGLDAFEQQAFSLVLGNSMDAFDVTKESAKTVDKYGSGLGTQMLQARRLCEAGCGFVTVSYGGWDMHGKIESAMNQRGPAVDRAVAAFVRDVAERGLTDKILLVVTGEFGRTPKINQNAGRDHWGPLCTMALSGGGLKMGQTVGRSDDKAFRPASEPITPQDVMATVFHVLGFPAKQQLVNQAGRPVYLVEEGEAISELV